MKKTLLASALALAFSTSALAANPTSLAENESYTATMANKNDLAYIDQAVTLGSNAILTIQGTTNQDGMIRNSSITGQKASLYMDVKGTGDCNSALGEGGGIVTVKKLDIESEWYGIYQSQSSAKKIEITADEITIKAHDHGIYTSAGSQIDFKTFGSLTIESTEGHAINNNGAASILIGDGTGSVTLKTSERGALSTMNSAASTTIDAANITIEATIDGQSETRKTSAIYLESGKLTLKAAGQLTISATKAEGQSEANGIGVTGGKLAVNATEAVVNGDIVASAGEVQLDGEMIFNGDKAAIANLTGEKATFTVTKADQDVTLTNNNSSLTLAASGDLNDTHGIAVINDIVTLSEDGTTEGVKVVAYEGMYSNETTAVLDGEGNLTNVAETTNSIMSNTLDLASAAPLAMNRLLMNDVRKRMGDLRAAEGTHGVWARYDGGKLSGERGLENDFTTVQVGIDTVPVVDAPRFGVAFAYTKSDADMMRGSADMDAFSLAFYGTKFYDNGMFVDVIGRMATADTDVTVEGQKGTMDNVALSLSGEFGWRFDVTDTFYVEPQAELTYTYVNADTLTLSDKFQYKFDSVDSLMGRVGFAAGFKCPNNFGDVYVRASAVHEFLGDATVTGASGKALPVDGEDTWVEFGIGANFNVNKNTYVYADIERTEGAKLEEDWRANVGVRFAF